MDGTTMTYVIAARYVKTVKAGESPWRIAAKILGDGRRYQEIQALARWGGVDPGQRLRIPV